MGKKIKINKPKGEDLYDIKKILSQWTDKKEADKYIKRIDKEIKGKTEYNMQFWVVRKNEKVIGVIGLSDILPKILPLAKTNRPGEIKILYVDTKNQEEGMGKLLVRYIEKMARENRYSELLVRSAKKYKDTAYGFYKKLGYSNVGKISGGKKNKIMEVFQKVLT